MKNSRFVNTKIVAFLYACIFLASSCAVKKYIPEGELLYTGAKIDVSSPQKVKILGDIESEMETLLRPEPNSKVLGFRLGLLAHYKVENKKRPEPFNKWLNKKMGEKPVYLSDFDPSYTEDLINNRLENKGFFRSEIFTTIERKKKTASLQYDVTVQKPYTLDSLVLDSTSAPIYLDIDTALNQTILKKGSRFDLDLLKAERMRIDQYLKSIGYYNFNEDFLIFEADTNNYENKSYRLFLKVKEETPEKSTIPYLIRKISVFPNYSLDSDKKAPDTTIIDGVDYIQNPLFFKPDKLSAYLLLKENQLYDPIKSKYTSNRLSSIGTYKFVNLRFEEVEIESDTGRLEARIMLSPLTKRAIKTELQALSKSNGFVGPALSVTYSNRNLFFAGETLNFNGSVGYEAQLAKGQQTGLNSTHFGLKSDLIIPRLVAPITIVHKFRYDVPKTKISGGVEYLKRSKLYSLTSFTGSFGYYWNATEYIYHELNPISINYLSIGSTTDRFQSILNENEFLKSSFDQQYIAGLTYTFVYNRIKKATNKFPILFTANLDVAGNALSLISTTQNNEGQNTVLGIVYAQYAKTDIDIQQQIKFKDGSHVLVGRVFAGLGVSYGNSPSLPYSKQYFSGGPYSVRAFRIRSLGPGTYTPQTNNVASFFDQAGDIRLEANLEYRFPIISVLNGAFFADAGNVWLMRENEDLPGSKFTNSFLQELGMGVGTGLRVDVQSFVIRLDVAVPINTPTTAFDFDYKSPVFNFAIGYPF